MHADFHVAGCAKRALRARENSDISGKSGVAVRCLARWVCRRFTRRNVQLRPTRSSHEQNHGGLFDGNFAASRRPAGLWRGCAAARAQVLALAGKLRSPIGHILRGKEQLERENPYDVVMTGLAGFASATKP